jgi:hypothetical protein
MIRAPAREFLAYGLAVFPAVRRRVFPLER